MASDASRHERFTTLLDLLAEPTVIVIEDLHWADEATLDLLVYLGRRLADTPSVLVLTYREHTPDPPPRMTEVMGHLSRSARTTRISLPALSLEAVTRLADGHDVEPARVHAVTGGNAFFVTEVLASEGDGLPDSVRDAVVGRAAGLSAGARAALETAAVVPDRVELDLLFSVSGASADDLEECERADLLEIGSRVATYRHELARNAVLDSLPAVRRRELHAAVVRHLMTLSGHHEARIAHHADLAGDAATVLTYAVTAADQAALLGSHREAAAQMDRVLAHLDAADPDRAAAILGRAAMLYQSTGRVAAGLDASTRAVALRREQDDVDLAVQLATLSRMLWVQARGTEARAAIDEAVKLITSRPGSPGEVMVLSTDSSLAMLAREIPRSLETGRRAVTLARERGDSPALVRALNAVGTASWFAVPDEAEPLLVESLHIAERLRDDIAVAAAMVNLGSGAGEVRRYERALHWLEQARSFCAERDLDHSEHYATSWVARIDLEQGRWNSARALTEHLLLGTDPISRIGALTVLAKVRLRRGEQDAGDLLDAAWEEAQRSGHLQRLWPVAAGRAELAWAAGRPDRAQEAVAETLDLASRLDQQWAIGELGWWSVRAGGEAPSGAAAPYAAMIAGDWLRAGDLWTELGCPWEAALSLAETDDPDSLQHASAELHRLGARPDAARVAQRMRGLGPRSSLPPPAYDGREPRRPHRPRARGGPPARRGRHQRRDRVGTLHLTRDGCPPRLVRARKAGCRQPARGRPGHGCLERVGHRFGETWATTTDVAGCWVEQDRGIRFHHNAKENLNASLPRTAHLPRGSGDPGRPHRRRDLPQVVAGNANHGVTWIHSYVSPDHHTTFCLYDAPAPDAIRSAAGANELPVDLITEVSVLDPYFYH